MNKIELAVLVGALGAAVSAFADADGWNRPQEKTRFVYVSPAGDDGNSGGKDDPVASLEGARDAVRGILADEDALPGGIVVEFADGTYRMDGPVEFGREDSGTPDCPVMYRAAHVGKAVFSGAADLKWTDGADGVKAAVLPGRGKLPGFDVGIGEDGYIADGNHQVSVYSDGRRMNLSCWPKGTRWARVDDQLAPEAPNGGWRLTTGVVRLSEDETGEKPDLVKWRKEKDIWVDGVWGWAYRHSCARVEQLDPQDGWIRIASGGTRSGIKRGSYGKLKNIVSEVDEPGEWAIDLDSRKVIAVPYDGEPPQVAWADGLIRVRRAEGISFEGFVLEHSRGPFVVIEGSRDVAVRTCLLRHGSGLGVFIRGGRQCRVEGCDLTDLGAGGVRADGGLHDALEPAGHVVDNCRIWDYAKTILYYQPGVSLRGVGLRATHNLIHHAPHMALGFVGNDHYLAYNVIHDVCSWTADAGAIYGYHVADAYSQRGTVIERNLLHMIGRQPRSGETEGIYIDGYSTGVTVRGNIISRATTGVFLQGGHDLVAERNIVINCRAWCRRRNLGKNDEGFGINAFARAGIGSEMLKSLVADRGLYASDKWQRAYPNVLRPLELAERDPDLAHATLFSEIVSNVVVASGRLQLSSPKTTAPKVVGNVELDDPGFVDYEGLDWELRDDAPARRTLGGGTRFAEMGLYASPLRFSPPRKFGEGVTPPRKLAAERLRALTRVTVSFDGELPKDAASFADGYRRCVQGPSNRGEAARNIWSDIGSEFFWCTGWRRHEMAFTPRFSGKGRIILWGEWGAKTQYRNVTLNGRPVTGWTVGDWTPAYVDPDEDVRTFEPRGEKDGVVWANATETGVAEVAFEKDVPVLLAFESKTDSQD